MRADRRELGGRRRVAAEVGVGEEAGAERERARPLDAAVERADGDLGRAAADVDHGHAPGQRAPERPRRAQEGQPRLLLPVEHGDLDAAVLADRRAELGAVGGAPDHGRGDGADGPRANLLGERVLLGDDARGLGDPGRRDRPSGRQPAAQAGEGAALQDLAQAAVARLGDQHPGGVRPDIDAAAEHSPARDVAIIGAMTSGVPAIEVTGLSKAYGSRHALRGVDFTVERGEVFGLLGPNGAGRRPRSRSSRAIARGIRAPCRVLGHDPGTRSAALRARVGIVLQSCGTYPHLTVRETVAHFASLYPAPRAVGEVLALAGLDECADRRARTLSGGQARRLDFALALVGDPELVFLDEPTTGFDPAARRAAWDVIRALKDLGKTVVLTTHYLDEAQALADRVAILQDGLILAEGPPDALGASRYRVAWRGADGALEERFTEDPTALLAAADRRRARARRAARGAERDAPEPRGRLPGADGGFA